MEFVYVVPREKLFPEYYPQGLLAFGDDLVQAEFEGAIARHGFFCERDYAERTPSLKQVIPYCVTICDGKVLVLKRLEQGGERRLHGKLSIGVGGHINPEDVGAGSAPSVGHSANVLEEGSRRELTEELRIEGTVDVRRYGVINDDSNAVGAVHVGVVQVVAVEGTVAVRELDQLEGQWIAPRDLQRMAEREPNFETWSQHIIEQLGSVLLAPVTA